MQVNLTKLIISFQCTVINEFTYLIGESYDRMICTGILCTLSSLNDMVQVAVLALSPSSLRQRQTKAPWFPNV